MLEELGCPGASTECRRTWGHDKEKKEGLGRKPKLLSVPPAGKLKKGKECFLISIQYRQNASWQGALSWIEGGREENFRSVLELLLLIDSALGGG